MTKSMQRARKMQRSVDKLESYFNGTVRLKAFSAAHAECDFSIGKRTLTGGTTRHRVVD